MFWIPIFSLRSNFVDSTRAVIWLTINDQNVSQYTVSDNGIKPITILCHQQTSSENISTWVFRLRSISKLSKTDPTSLPNPTSDVWNITYEWPMMDRPQIYADRRRTTLASIWRTSQYYWATGYTIIGKIIQ